MQVNVCADGSVDITCASDGDVDDGSEGSGGGEDVLVEVVGPSRTRGRKSIALRIMR